MKRARFAILATCLGILISGCASKSVQNSVKIGMTADQVRAALGAPFITGNYTNLNPANKIVQERWTYAQGHDGFVVLIENGTVKQTEVRKSPLDVLTGKVKEGMTQQQVLTALGQPMGGYNPRFPQQDGIWVYGDFVAPVDTLNVVFKGGKVQTATVAPNMAYTNR